MTTLQAQHRPAPIVSHRGIPGHYVVVGLFFAGIVATVLIFLYWDWHTRPFRPLTEAIGREFSKSLPKVEGGSHKGSPMTLRIAMRVPFEPDEGHPETRQVVNRVVELTRQHADLSRFEQFQVHLFQLAPERVAKQASFEYPIERIMKTLPFAAEE